MKTLQDLIDDEFGSMDVCGYIFMVTILAIGGIVGLATFRNGVVQEYGDVGLALRNINQSFSIGLPAIGYVTSHDDDTPEDGYEDSDSGAPPPGLNLTKAPLSEGEEDPDAIDPMNPNAPQPEGT